MDMIKHIASAGIGFASGMVVSGAVFAFITVVGVVPRLAQKTRTQGNIRMYESAIVLGGIFGTASSLWQFYVPIGLPGMLILSLCNGIFVGCLAMALAEVLNVIPILTRRGRIQRGMFFFVMAIALGKFVGSLLYFLIPGFFDASN